MTFTTCDRIPIPAPPTIICDFCDGCGRVAIDHPNDPSDDGMDCPECDGDGYHVAKYTCSGCDMDRATSREFCSDCDEVTDSDITEI